MSLLYGTLPMWWSQWAWPTPHPTLHFSQLFLAPSLSVLFSSYDLTSVSGKAIFPLHPNTALSYIIIIIPTNL